MNVSHTMVTYLNSSYAQPAPPTLTNFEGSGKCFFLQQWSSAFTGYRRIHFTLMEASKELNKYGAIETTKGSLGFKTLEELMKVI